MTKPPELDVPVEQKAIISELMDIHGFSELKDTQAFAFERGILEDGNDLLVAPTGNGKTLTAEAIVKKHLQQGNRVAYLVPSKQLEWAKKDTLSQWAGDDHRVYNGSGKYQSADVAVATFESFFRAAILEVKGMEDIDAVILDDFHELYSDFRGVEIELDIAAALSDKEIYAISATINDAEEVANWMDATAHVSPEGRQIPIEEHAIESSTASTKQQIINVIDEHQEKGPFLVFCFAKDWTESRAQAIGSEKMFNGPPKQEVRNEISDRVDGVLTSTHKEIVEMIASGAAYIHSDVPGSIKQYILELFEDERIEAITTTTSLAYGFDSPVQSVIIADEKRRGEWINVYEYIQFAGRAARPQWGYDKGYCFTLTGSPEEAEERFFKPDRDLERVKSHIDDEDAFRWVVLELIENGWTSTAEINEFMKRTLYYEQLPTDEVHGQTPRPKEERMKDRIDDTADWLIDKGFVEKSETWGTYSTTYLGEGAVEFDFNSWVDANLMSVKQFYNWINSVDHDTLTQLDYLYQVVMNFEQEMTIKNADNLTEGLIQEYGYDTSEAGLTAAIIRWYWMQNASLEDIERKVGVDPTYLPGLAGKISRTISATEHLVKAAPNAHEHEWMDSLITRVEKGVNEDASGLVEKVDGMGRNRVRSLRNYLQKTARTQMNSEPTQPLHALLDEFHSYCGDESRFEDMLIEQVSMIGEVTASNIIEYQQEVEPDTTRVATEEENARNEKIESSSKNHDYEDTGELRASGLDEFA